MHFERSAVRAARLTAIGLALLASSIPAVGQISHTFANIAPPGATETQAWGVNNAGSVVGYFDSSAGRQGFLFKNGGYSAVAVPGATQTLASGINDAEQIVGNYLTPSGQRRGFLLNSGVFTNIDYPGAVHTHARGINNSGQIVGSYESGGTSHGFLLDAGVYSPIDVPGSNYAQALGINSAGVVSGFHYDSTAAPIVVRGFRLQSGSFTNIEFPGAGETYAGGINDGLTVAGFFGPGAATGFLEQGGTFTSFVVPSAAETYPASISTGNLIVGAWRSPSQPLIGFLATPGVSYQVCLLYDPTKPKKSGSTVPIKLRLCAADGTNVSAPTKVVHAVSVTKVSDTTTPDVPDAGNSNPDQNFRYDAELAGYIYNLKTTGLSAGSYTVDFTAGADATLYHAPFQVK